MLRSERKNSSSIFLKEVQKSNKEIDDEEG